MKLRPLYRDALMLAIGLLLGTTLVGAKETSMREKITQKSVKICATYEGGSSGCGTGTLMGNGFILSEDHVVKEKIFDMKLTSHGIEMAELRRLKVVVLRPGSTDFISAVVINTNPKRDLAILKIQSSDSTPLVFTRNWVRGEKLYVVGNPFGIDFDYATVTITGVMPLVNAKGEFRDIITLDNRNESIRPGFSGGALFNSEGQVVGLVELAWPEGVAGAIPAKDIENYFKEIK